MPLSVEGDVCNQGLMSFQSLGGQNLGGLMSSVGII